MGEKMTKTHKIDRTDRMIAYGYVRKYEIYKAQVESERNRIMSQSSNRYRNKIDSNIKDQTGSQVIELEKLDQRLPSRVVHAIEYALSIVCSDMEEKAGKKFAGAILTYCKRPRNGTRLGVSEQIPYSRTVFFEKLSEFLDIIKRELGF